jgi:hypothetical protein
VKKGRNGEQQTEPVTSVALPVNEPLCRGDCLCLQRIKCKFSFVLVDNDYSDYCQKHTVSNLRNRTDGIKLTQ